MNNHIQPRNQKEQTMQRELIQLRDLFAPLLPALRLLHHVPNGGYRRPQEAAILQGMGVLAGMPDLCLPVPSMLGPQLYIELKAPGGVLSALQFERISQLQSCGNMVQVCFSLEAAWANLCFWLHEHLIKLPFALSDGKRASKSAARSILGTMTRKHLSITKTANGNDRILYEQEIWHQSRHAETFGLFLVEVLGCS